MNIQIRGGIRGTEQLGLDLVTEASPLNEYSIKGQTSGNGVTRNKTCCSGHAL